MKYYYRIIVGILCISLIAFFTWWFYLKKDVDKQKIKDKESTITNLMKHPEALQLLEELYKISDNEFTIVTDNIKLEIAKGDIKTSEKKEKILIEFFHELECSAIYLEKEDGIKFLRIVLKDIRIDENNIYLPEVYYCGDKDKYIDYHGEDLSRIYGDEFMPNWYYKRLSYNI